MTDLYDGFAIESFEAEGLWHARIQPANRNLVALDGVLFPPLEIGLTWPNSEAAIAGAKQHIDRFRRRRAG